MGIVLKRYTAREEAFWRKLLLPQERRHSFFPPWTGSGYRWFESPNVHPIEHYRRPNPGEAEAGSA